MTKAKNPRGGKRQRAGRKPASDPKIGITVYAETSKVDAMGGKEKCKSKILTFISKEAKK